jgi:5'-AMP-activated protein kinase regulatory gamma subunit
MSTPINIAPVPTHNGHSSPSTGHPPREGANLARAPSASSRYGSSSYNAGTGTSQRRQSHSQPPVSASGSVNANGTSGTLGRRPSRATHPPMVPPKPLTHTEALEALRAFLKERSSYDVFPVSFRLIVLDTTLKVKKALDVMLLYGECDTFLP